MTGKNRYSQIVEEIFLARYQKGARDVPFEREDIIRTARKLRIPLPKNLGGLIYSFRYRAALPERIMEGARGHLLDHPASGTLQVLLCRSHRKRHRA